MRVGGDARRETCVERCVKTYIERCVKNRVVGCEGSRRVKLLDTNEWTTRKL